MKIKHTIKGILTLLVLTISFVSCNIEDYDVEVIDELTVKREFAPIELTAKVRNQTSVELNWVTKETISHYIVEISADDATFSTIYKTQEITSDQLPIQIRLEGETLYSIRLKGISNRGLEDSSWALAEAQTLTEQIMLPAEPGDIKALEATLRWEAGLNVTHIMLEPGTIRHEITAQEKAAGIATISSLVSETAYSAVLYNNAKIRGTSSFTTGIDIGDNTLVLPTDDLFQMISDAAPGDILLLEQGDYTSQIGTITLDKSITIQGLRTDFKPRLKVGFSIVNGATDVSLIDLNLTGDVPSQLIDVVSYSDIGNYNSLLISGCNIHDYDRSFVRGNTTNGILQSLVVENTIVSNVFTSGGDFIDFRNSDVLNVNLNTSTFNNCAVGRDFLRLDDAGASTQTGLTCNVTLNKNTFYACNTGGKRLLYVRFQSNKITVKNNLITDTDAKGFSDQSRTDQTPTLLNNNYFNASGYLSSAVTIFDSSGTHTELNPGYTNAANGNFTISNQTLKDNLVGDPRWIK